MKMKEHVTHNSNGGLTMKTWLMCILLGIFSVCSLTGCETMEGFGRDVEKTGDKIEDAADR
jgi:entericidin A